VQCAAGYTGTPVYTPATGAYSSGCDECATNKYKSTTGNGECHGTSAAAIVWASTSSVQCAPGVTAAAAGIKYDDAGKYVSGCDICINEVFSSTNLGSDGTNNIIFCGSSSGSVCGEFDSSGNWDWIGQEITYRDRAFYALSSAKYTSSDAVIGRVFVDAYGWEGLTTVSSSWDPERTKINGNWEDDDYCSVHFKACSTADCAAAKAA
jgi:hypothetical protein